MVYLFAVQKRDDARRFLKYLHPDLGVGTNPNIPLDMTMY